MALYGTPSLEEFRNKQSLGTFSFDYNSNTGVGTKPPLEVPYVDNSAKDAVKVPEVSSAAIPREKEAVNLIEKARIGQESVLKKMNVNESLDSKLNSSLLEKYRNSTGDGSPAKEIFVPFNEGVIDPKRDTSFDLKRFGKELADKESSGGNYKLASKVSSAAGKYQFLWGTWGEKISKVTGVKSKGDFLNNPRAQEKFFEWYTHNEVLPQARKLQQQGAHKGFNLMDIAKLIHFRGAAGTRAILKKDASTYSKRDIKNNMGVYEFLNKGKFSREKGG